MSDELLDRWVHRYTSIRSRCYVKTHAAYACYGGRGIRMHDEWRESRLAFLLYVITLDNWDVDGLDLDRIDNDGHYEPGNIRLVPRGVNSNNKRNTVYLSGVPLTEWARTRCPLWTVGNVRYHHARGRSPEWILARYRATRACV